MTLALLHGGGCQPNEWLAFCAVGLVVLMSVAWGRHRRARRVAPRPGAGRAIAVFVGLATFMLVEILLQIRSQPGAWGTC